MIADFLAIVSFCLRHWKGIALLVVMEIGCHAIQGQGDVRLYSSGPGVVYSYAELVGALEDAGVPPVGPWQINVLAHPNVSPECAMELGCAARAAARISSYGRNWSAWSTYNSGAFGSYLVA